MAAGPVSVARRQLRCHEHGRGPPPHIADNSSGRGRCEHGSVGRVLLDARPGGDQWRHHDNGIVVSQFLL
jgi:hypothetical protein